MMKSSWNINNRKINIALVGCGRIAKNHFQAIEQNAKDLNLVAVCDTEKKSVQAASKLYGVPGYLSLKELLEESTVDIVTLCTPSGIHARQAIQIAKAGKHVLTEKPMATRWRDGLQMVQACDEAGVRLYVVKQNRLNPTLQLLKKAVENNRFGKIYMVNINVFWTRPQDYYDHDKWRGTWEYDGGAFMNQASHYIDLARWLLGPVQSVQAMMGTLGRKIEAEDTGVLNLRWRSGAVGSVNVTMLTYPKNYEGSITILGEKGTVRVGGVAVNDVQQWEFDQSDIDDTSIHDISYQTTSVYGFGHPLYYTNVIQSLRGEQSTLVDGREGLTSLELLIASYRAARDGSTIHLPLEL